MMMLWRAVAGLLLAVAISGAARRARSLAPSGAAAAIVVGTLAVAAGWRWGAVLVAFFVGSTALSHWRAAAKEARTSGVVAKGGERDATQVLANGGVFALAALVAVATRWGGAEAVGIGALAAATSDTWGTEIGTLARRMPRSIVSWQPVPPGTSGGVTVPGLVASLAGALFIAAVARALGWSTSLALAALAGGVAGSTVDSLLGALAQERRWCDRCEEPTERGMHVCGTPTRHLSGVAWLGNDAVNVACTAAGGLVTWALWAL